MDVTYDFTGRVVFITGASSGIGRDTTRAFARAGATVIATDINESALQATIFELRDAGHAAHAIVADVTDERSIARAVAATVAEHGRLDFAFNNAGIMPPPAYIADQDATAFDAVTAVNLRGVWASMKQELKHMREQGSGAIVNCSSIGGLVGAVGRGSYHATKHGILGLTKSAAIEYGPLRIRVNAVCPGTIATPLSERMFQNGDLDRDITIAGTPLGRLGRGAEIADAVLWLCSDSASYVTGIALPVDGGLAAQ